MVENNYYFYQEYVFNDLPNRRFDFALYNKDNPNNIIKLIEFDGEQHSINSKSGWHNDDLIKRDIEKNNYALQNNIPLVRIPYYKTSVSYKDIFGDKFLVEE